MEPPVVITLVDFEHAASEEEKGILHAAYDSDNVKKHLGAGCIGALFYKITYDDGTFKDYVCVEVSGNGGKKKVECINEIEESIRVKGVKYKGNEIIVAPPFGDRSIYSDCPGTTLSASYLFPVNLVERMMRFTESFNEVRKLSSDGMTEYREKLSKQASKTVDDRDKLAILAYLGRINNEFEWEVTSEFWTNLSNLKPETRRNHLETTVSHWMMSPREIIINWAVDVVKIFEDLDVVQKNKPASTAPESERREYCRCWTTKLIGKQCLKEEALPDDILCVLLAYLYPEEEDPRRTSICDIFAQCAEDNVVCEVYSILKEETKTMTKIHAKWFSTMNPRTSQSEDCKSGDAEKAIDEPPVHKPLCEFCHLRFVERTEQLFMSLLKTH